MFTLDMGIDLGTANTLVYIRNQGIVSQEPSVVAFDRDTGNVLAVGNEAKHMVGRTPGNVIAVRPLKDGVIADFDITEKMLHHFITKSAKRRVLTRLRVVVGVPSGSTPVEKRAVIDAAMSAGAREVKVIEEPMAAAIGVGLPVHEPRGSMIIDIGGGTTDIAVISLGGIVVQRSVRIGGDNMDEAIIQHVRRKHNVLIGDRTAENLKIEIGSALPFDGPDRVEVRGRNLVTGLPTSFEVTAEEVRESLEESVSNIIDAVRATLERTPPELMSDIMESGIVMAGGGALLRGLDERISRETQVAVHVCDDPLSVVARGTGMALDMLDLLTSAHSIGD